MFLKQDTNNFIKQNERMCKHQAICSDQCVPSSPLPSIDSRSCDDEVHATMITSSPTNVDAFPILEEIAQGSKSKPLWREKISINGREEYKKQVSFSDLSIREYNLVVGDKKSLAAELGWKVHSEYSETIETFESTRTPRRSGDDLILRRKQKRDRLKMTGCSEMELVLAKREQELREREEFFGTSSRNQAYKS